MNLSEYASYDGMGLAELVKKTDVSAAELATLANRAIETVNPKLNFLAHSVNNQTHTAGCEKDGLKPFWGVPTLIKDSMLQGQPFELGSRIARGWTAGQDGEMARRLKKAGCNIVGISTMPEWGSSPTTESLLYGKTRNPWDLKLSAGGSSGGAAAAVAAGVVPFAQASDAGGSIRIPAACCGLVGLKPTRARTPEHQYVPFSPSVSHVVTRSVRDTAALLDLVHGSESGAIYFTERPRRPFIEEVYRSPSTLKIGYSMRSFSGGKVHPDCQQAVTSSLKVCESMGYHIEEVDLPVDWQHFQEAFTLLWAYRHPYSVYLTEVQTGRLANSSTREANNLALYQKALNTDLYTFDRHLRYLAELCTQIGKLFEQLDVFVSPVTSRPGLKLGELDANAHELSIESWVSSASADYAPFTPIFNVTGQPAISLPLSTSKNGMPVGVQFVAKHSDEATLLQLAGLLEEEMPWSQRYPKHSLFALRDQ